MRLSGFSIPLQFVLMALVACGCSAPRYAKDGRWRRLEELNTRDMEAVSRARSYWTDGNVKEASRMLEIARDSEVDALELDPNNLDALMGMSEYFEMTDSYGLGVSTKFNMRSAVSYYERALARAKSSDDKQVILEAISKCLSRMGDSKRAAEYMRLSEAAK